MEYLSVDGEPPSGIGALPASTGMGAIGGARGAGNFPPAPSRLCRRASPPTVRSYCSLPPVAISGAGISNARIDMASAHKPVPIR